MTGGRLVAIALAAMLYMYCNTMVTDISQTAFSASTCAS